MAFRHITDTSYFERVPIVTSYVDPGHLSLVAQEGTFAGVYAGTSVGGVQLLRPGNQGSRKTRQLQRHKIRLSQAVDGHLLWLLRGFRVTGVVAQSFLVLTSTGVHMANLYTFYNSCSYITILQNSIWS